MADGGKTQDRRLWPFVPGGRPVPVASAEGCWLTLKDGTRILDAAGGAIASNIGHGRGEVAAAAARGIEKASYIVPTFSTEEREALVAELRTHWLPDRLPHIWFGSGGSDANDAAIRLARQHHVSAGRAERHKVVYRRPSYHGVTLATIGVSGHPARRAAFDGMMPDQPWVHAPYSLRYQGQDETADLLEELRQVIDREGADTIAAFIVEPITGSSGGALLPPEGYWQGVQDICRANGILIILDEVMTGFGRLGARFGAELYDIQPDIMVSGKGLSSGYAPIVGMFASDEVIAPLAADHKQLMFYTHSANNGACAAALKVLEILREEKLVERCAQMGRVMDQALAPLRQHPNVAEVRGRGLLWAIEIVEDRNSLNPFPEDMRMTDRIVGAGLGNGAFFYPGGTGDIRDVICLGPAFTVSEEEIKTAVSLLEQSIDQAIKST